MTTTALEARIWRRFTPAQRIARFAVYLAMVTAVVMSIQSVEVIPEFLLDAPEQMADLLKRMWPVAFSYYPKGVHEALVETLHIATLGTILAVVMAFPIGIMAAYNITPSQSNKDYNARASERSQAITGNGNRPSARGGDVIAFGSKEYAQDAGDVAPPLRAMGSNKDHPNGGGQIAIAFNARQDPTHGPVADPLGTKDTGHGFLRGSAVRRLTPRECERLQGFPDDYTLISHRGKPAADGPRYKALGNSMAVPVMRWIGERIAMVEAAQEAAA